MIYNYKDPDELHMDMDIWEDARQQALRDHDYKKAYQAKEQMSNIQKAEILEEEELLLWSP